MGKVVNKSVRNNKKNKNDNNKLLEFVTKYKLYIIIAIFLLLFLALYIIYGLNDTSYAIDSDNVDGIVLSCPEVVSAGDEFDCTANLNVVSVEGQAFQSDIELSDGLEFKKFTREKNCTINDAFQFTGGNCWSTISASSDSFIVFNDTNSVYKVSGMTELGTLKYKISDDAVSGKNYSIIIKNAFIGYTNENGEGSTLDLQDVTANIRIASDVNTLSDITLSKGSLNEKVTTDRNTYTATVDSDKVTINVTKSDESSVISDKLNNIALHYGTNNITFKVISESGKENTYTIAINRPYEFSTDSYIYNKDNNYLYTRADTDSETIKANISLDSGLSGSISDGKFIIKYGDEVLKAINIVNVNFGSYVLSDGNIYLGDNIEISSFKNGITTNGVSVGVYDGDLPIGDGKLLSTYKIKVYYDNTKLEEYGIKVAYLKFSNKLVIDDKNNIIKKLENGTTYEKLQENIETSGTISLKNKSGKNLENNDIVKTGDVVEITVGDEVKRYTISVLGDINGDGDIDVADVNKLFKYSMGRIQLTKQEFFAGDIINDSSIEINDVNRLSKYSIGKITKLNS